ncbi:hypothetical protein B0H13DRAFT_2568349 [Mycena leptocephala]|nr:hypothetical protein B0H13DRAFT_2568349 [Mycena leptocephala]
MRGSFLSADRVEIDLIPPRRVDDEPEAQIAEDNQRIWENANAQMPMPSLIVSGAAAAPPAAALQPKMRILKRPTNAGPVGLPPPTVAGETLKEREARYQAARERIFGAEADGTASPGRRGAGRRRLWASALCAIPEAPPPRRRTPIRRGSERGAEIPRLRVPISCEIPNSAPSQRPDSLFIVNHHVSLLRCLLLIHIGLLCRNRKVLVEPTRCFDAKFLCLRIFGHPGFIYVASCTHLKQVALLSTPPASSSRISTTVIFTDKNLLSSAVHYTTTTAPSGFKARQSRLQVGSWAGATSCGIFSRERAWSYAQYKLTYHHSERRRPPPHLIKENPRATIGVLPASPVRRMFLMAIL